MTAHDSISNIMIRATQIANEQFAQREGIEGTLFSEFQPFAPSVWTGNNNPFSMEIDQNTHSMMSAHGIEVPFDEIVTDSIQKSIHENKEEFIGVIIGYQKQGANFFDAIS
jgi:hypothetical protein